MGKDKKKDSNAVRRAKKAARRDPNLADHKAKRLWQRKNRNNN